jgi:pimeloyl-ACP methyl ester carboxylesterase
VDTSLIDTGLGPVAVRHTRVVSGTATILLHGAAGSWTTWLPAIEAAGGAEATDDLVMPDLPGWGESPADPSRLDPESLARAVAAVARALGYRRWRVLGHSMGGFVALELAVLEPEATVSVLLVSATTLGGRGDRLGRLGLVGAAPPLALMLAGMRLLAATGAAAAPFVRWLDRRGLLGLLLAPLFDGRQPAAVHELARDLRPTAFVRAVACLRRYPAAERWSTIRCPVMAVHGDHDVFAPAEDDVRLAGIIPRFSALALPATGHFGHVERPGVLAGVLRSR